jgi:hypothetical protein
MGVANACVTHESAFTWVVATGVLLLTSRRLRGLLQPASLNSTQLNSTQLNSTQLNPTQLNSTQLNSTQLNSTQLNSTQLNSTQLNPTQLNSTQFNSTQLRRGGLGGGALHRGSSGGALNGGTYCERLKCCGAPISQRRNNYEDCHDNDNNLYDGDDDDAAGYINPSTPQRYTVEDESNSHHTALYTAVETECLRRPATTPELRPAAITVQFWIANPAFVFNPVLNYLRGLIVA